MGIFVLRRAAHSYACLIVSERISVEPLSRASSFHITLPLLIVSLTMKTRIK